VEVILPETTPGRKSMARGKDVNTLNKYLAEPPDTDFSFPENEASRCSGRNRSKGEYIVPAGGGDFDGTFYMLLTFDFPKIKFLFTGSRLGPTVD
jgi:hypothetical protein